MEPRANYVATGAFVILVIAGLIVAALWLSHTRFRTTYAPYEVRVAGSVSGLDPGAPVRLNGLDIGRVTRITEDPENPQGVIVHLKIRNEVVIHADAVASVEMQGLTGTSYVEIAGGSLGAPRLVAAAGKVPVIAFRESALQVLFNDAPAVFGRLVGIEDRLQAILDNKNRKAIAAALANVRDLTAVLARRSHDLNQMITDGGSAMHNLAKASAEGEALIASFDRLPGKTDRLIASANTTFEQASKLAADLDNVVQNSRDGIQELTTTVPARLDALLVLANRLAERLDRLAGALERNPSQILFGPRQEGYRPP